MVVGGAARAGTGGAVEVGALPRLHGTRERLAGLDAVRGLAVVAMIAAHYERVLSNQLGPEWLGWLLRLPDGRVAPLFFAVAGMGVSLLVAGDPLRGRGRVARRALVLTGLGYAFLPLWEADVLHVLGPALLAGAALARAATGLLVLLAAGIALTPGLFAALRLDPARGWVLEQVEYADLWTVEGHLRHLVFNGFHPLYPGLAFLLLGLLLGRCPDRLPRLLAPAVAVAAGAELARPWTPQPLAETLAVLSRAGIALGAIALGMRWAGRGGVLALLGRFPLTLYFTHVLVGIGAFDLFHRLGFLSRGQTLAWWAATAWIAVAACAAWGARFRTGPAEGFLRWASRSR